MEKTTAKSQTQLSMLPEDLIVEHVLPNLPVKTLIRFKSVSKYWLLTISSHEFMQKHLKFSSSCPQLIILQKGYIANNPYLLALDERSNVKELVKLVSKYPWEGSKSTRVIGSYNGLVCLYNTAFCFYLWNPATHQCRNAACPDISYIAYPSPEDIDYPSSDDIAGVGFGYVSSMDDYRIGCFLWERDEVMYHVYIFSWRTGKWKRTASLDESYYYFMLRRSYVSLSIDDVIYWPPIVMDHGEVKKKRTVGLDLVSGQLKKIPLEKHLIIGYDKIDVFRMKGCLALCCISNLTGEGVCDVWMLKQHDDWNSWEKVYSLNNGVYGDTRMLHLFETGKCVVGRYLEELKLIDPSKVTSREQFEEGTFVWQGSEEDIIRFVTLSRKAWGYVESLISPFGTTAYDGEGDGYETSE